MYIDTSLGFSDPPIHPDLLFTRRGLHTNWFHSDHHEQKGKSVPMCTNQYIKSRDYFTNCCATMVKYCTKFVRSVKWTIIRAAISEASSWGRRWRATVAFWLHSCLLGFKPKVSFYVLLLSTLPVGIAQSQPIITQLVHLCLLIFFKQYFFYKWWHFCSC